MALILLSGQTVISLHGCRADERSESESVAKPRFCEATMSARQDVLARVRTN